MNSKKLFIVIGIIVLNLLYLPKITSAYTDNSIYRIETGEFIGEENVKNALYKLQADTGWWTQYQATGRSIPYYQVISGEIHGEEKAKEQLIQLQSVAGISGSYSPVGGMEQYQKIVSGGFQKDRIEGVLEKFTQYTGISATYEPVGESISKEQILSGGFYGETTVQSIVQKFVEATGIKATYEPVGEQPEYHQIISGGFAGEAYTNSVMQNFITQTGVNATYEPIEYIETYTITTGGFRGEQVIQELLNRFNNDLGIKGIYFHSEADIYKIKFEKLSEDMMQKISVYLNQYGWWFSTTSEEKTGTIYRIVSQELLDKDQINQALKFFSSQNWWASVNSTGKKENVIFRIVSDPIDNETILNKGLNFFKNNNWWVTTQATSESYYLYYKIVSEPLLGKEKIEKGLNFFEENNWWVSTLLTGEIVHVNFRIITNPILGIEQTNVAINTLRSAGYEAIPQATGKQEGSYKIMTGGFKGLETTNNFAKILTEKYGWWVTTVLIEPGSKIFTSLYDLTFELMLDTQMKVSPQTDLYRNDPAWISLEFIDSNNVVIASSLNVRSGPGINHGIVGKLSKGNKVTILERKDGWARILLTWRNASKEDVQYYLNPNNFQEDTIAYLQFLDLSKSAGLSISEVNEKILNNKGILTNQAQAFVKAATTYNINELYLISHAFLETGNGQSQLAEGVLVSVVDGKAVTPRIVYNMYGIGAYDGVALQSGSEYAYKQGWFSPEASIIGGAKFISESYVNHEKYRQNTLYKMRWNPSSPGTHQYATDIAWAYKQVSNINKFYNLLDTYILVYDVPKYK